MISKKVSLCEEVLNKLLVTNTMIKIKPLCVILSKMNGYAKGFYETKAMCFELKMKNCQKFSIQCKKMI